MSHSAGRPQGQAGVSQAPLPSHILSLTVSWGYGKNSGALSSSLGWKRGGIPSEISLLTKGHP